MKETLENLARSCQKVRDTAYRLKKRVVDLEQDHEELKCQKLVWVLEETLEEVKEQLKDYKDGIL